MIPQILSVTMTLLMLKSNYLSKSEDFCYLEIIRNESPWLFFSVQQETKTVKITVAFTFKNHTVSSKKPRLPKGWIDTVHLFSFNAHMYIPQELRAYTYTNSYTYA